MLDTDIGGDIDDAICLAYLLKEPQCELAGITTVCGDRKNVRRWRTQFAGLRENGFRSWQGWIPPCSPFRCILRRTALMR